jgi:DNA-binding MarR family transcriptional regulator
MSGDRGERLYSVVRYLRPLVLNSARVVDATLRPAGVTVGMRAVLEDLHEKGAGTVPLIAGHLDLPRQGVQRHVNDLLALGYVETKPNRAHRRSVLLALTPTGRQVIEDVITADFHQLATLAVDCTEEEIRIAAKVLASLDRDVRDRAAALHHTGSGDAR